MNVNVINEALGVRKSVTENLKVGMCATMFVGSDEYPMVITEVISPTIIRVADMHDGDYECNKRKDKDGIEFLPNEYMFKYVRVNDEGTNIVPIGDIFTFRKNKRWIEKGCGLWETGGLHIGEANEYRDPNF